MGGAGPRSSIHSSSEGNKAARSLSSSEAEEAAEAASKDSLRRALLPSLSLLPHRGGDRAEASSAALASASCLQEEKRLRC